MKPVPNQENKGEAPSSPMKTAAKNSPPEPISWRKRKITFIQSGAFVESSTFLVNLREWTSNRLVFFLLSGCVLRSQSLYRCTIPLIPSH